MKKNKSTWISEMANAFYVDAVARNTPDGTVGKRHTQRIAAQHGRKGLFLWRVEQIKKWTAICGVIGLIVFIITNWH